MECVVYRGKIVYLSSLAKELGLDRNTVRRRIKSLGNGSCMQDVESILKAKLKHSPTNPKHYMYEGRLLRLSQVAKASGLSLGLLRKRMLASSVKDSEPSVSMAYRG